MLSSFFAPMPSDNFALFVLSYAQNSYFNVLLGELSTTRNPLSRLFDEAIIEMYKKTIQFGLTVHIYTYF